jgi:hypothetical protein
MNPLTEHVLTQTRRAFFGQTALGLGAAALAALPGRLLAPLADKLQAPHFAPRARRAIWLFMAEGPSQLDTFDYKPALAGRFDHDLPESVRMGQRLTTMTSGQSRFPLAPSIYRFAKHDNGGDGAWVSELLPHVASIVDRLAIVKSMFTESINHDPAITHVCTGRELPGWPSLGAWLSYGLGSVNANLPSFVVMTPSWTGRKEAQALFNRLWGAGVLPSRYQGVALRAKGDPVLFLRNPPGVSPAARRRMLDRLADMNEREHEAFGHPETRTRIAQYEMAFRMQTSVPELTDLADEPESTFALYGPDARTPGTFAASCILARRLLERDVRFVQIFHRGWDQHFVLPTDLPNQCRDVDQPAAALILDLERRGLLDDTLVIWGGEFGRTVYCQGELTTTNYGRDHHPRCFTYWLAGGGIKRGVVHGETDDFSYNITADPVHVRDLNATILHCLGIEPDRLSVKHQGLDVKLVGVQQPARVVREILA